MIKHTRSMTNNPPGTNGLLLFFESILVQYMEKTCKTWCSSLYYELSGSTGGTVHYYCISFLELLKSLIQLIEPRTSTNKVLYQITSHDTCAVQQDSHEGILHCPFVIVMLDFTIYHKKQREWNEWTPVTCYVLASYVAQQSLKIRFPLASMVLKGSLKEVSSPPERKCIITKNFRYLEMEDTKIPFTLFFGYFLFGGGGRGVSGFPLHQGPYPYSWCLVSIQELGNLEILVAEDANAFLLDRWNPHGSPKKNIGSSGRGRIYICILYIYLFKNVAILSWYDIMHTYTYIIIRGMFVATSLKHQGADS